MNTDHTDPIDERALSQLMDGEWHGLDRSACVAGLCADPELRRTWARWHLVRDALRGEGVAAAPDSLAGRVAAAIADEPAYSNVTPWPGRADAAGVPTHASTQAPVATSAAAGAPGGAPVPAPAAPASPGGGRGPRISRLGATGFALAASAALVTVVGLNAWQSGAPASPGATGGAAGDAAIARAPLPGPSSAAPAPTDPVAAALRVDEAFALRPPTAPATLPEVDLVANTDGAGSYWVAGDGGARRGASERRLNAFLSRHIESSPGAAQQGMLPYSRLVGYDELGTAAPSAPLASPGAGTGR